jgi:hypothetical protein
MDTSPWLSGVAVGPGRLAAVETPGPLEGTDAPGDLVVLSDDLQPLWRDDGMAAARRRWWLGTPEGRVMTEVTLTLYFSDRGSAAERLEADLVRQMRRIPRDRIRKLDEPGDIAVGWGWERKETFDVIALLRANAVVTARGQGGVPLSLLRSIDTSLQAALRLRAPDHEKLLGPLPTSAAPLARVELGYWPASVASACSAGHVNRDPDDPDLAYYRAPATPGPAWVAIVEPLAGLLARHEHAEVTVAGVVSG